MNKHKPIKKVLLLIIFVDCVVDKCGPLNNLPNILLQARVIGRQMDNSYPADHKHVGAGCP